MNRKIVKIILIILVILIILGLLYYVISDLKSNFASNMKRDGFDVLLPDKDICTISIDGDTLWAGGASGLFEIDMKSFTAKNVGDYKFIRAVLAVDGGLWLGSDDGLTYIGEKTINYTVKEGLPDNRVNAIILDKDKRLWVGTWGGVAVFDGEKIKTYTKKDGLLDNMVNVIMQDSADGMWFGSYVAPRGGISVLYNEKWQYFTTNDALLHANINAIIERQDKSIIAGGGLYNKGGATRFVFQSDKWVKNGTITKKDGLAGEKVRSLFEDSNNRLWFGSEYDGLAVMSENKIIKLTKKNGLSNDEVKVIREDESNNIWVGTRKGLIRINKGGIDNE